MGNHTNLGLADIYSECRAIFYRSENGTPPHLGKVLAYGWSLLNTLVREPGFEYLALSRGLRAAVTSGLWLDTILSPSQSGCHRSNLLTVNLCLRAVSPGDGGLEGSGVLERWRGLPQVQRDRRMYETDTI